VTTKKNEVLKGDVVSVTEKEVVLQQGDKKVATPIKEVVKIDFQEIGKPPSNATYAAVELTDGTVLLCSKWSIRRKEVELTVLNGPTVKLALSGVANILSKANVEANRHDWTKRVFKSRGRDVLVLERGGKPQSIGWGGNKVTFGEADATGTTIEYTLLLDDEVETRKQKLAAAYGLIFKRVSNPKAPPVICKLLDTVNNVVMVSSLASDAAGFTVTTPEGVKMTFTKAQVARLDYTKGRLEYLSDLDPLKVVARGNLDEDGKDHPQRDRLFRDVNVRGKKVKQRITLGGVPYPKGLAIRPYAEVEYDLKGDYQELSALIGFDDNIVVTHKVELVVEGDGKELASYTLSPEDAQRFRPVTLNVKDVQKLKLVVRVPGDGDEVATHVSLADAKVYK
jgi:hypothetical protein